MKPKFHKSNGDRLYPIRFHLINAGIYYQNKDEALAYKNLATYVDSNDYPLFKEQDKSTDASLTQMAYYAARFAYFAKEYDKAENMQISQSKIQQWQTMHYSLNWQLCKPTEVT